MGIEQFQDLIKQKAIELYRDMPWREDTRPYFVLVSELMLQQTQVARVIPKFEAFINAFPSEKELAAASLADVLIYWQGLGYNRRAKFLHEATKQIVARGTFPNTYEDLLKLPGVGKNTAGAILAYSFNQPSIFIETNIRTVYIHHFFNNQFDINDKQLIELLEQTIDREHPREFYWALMDYGSWLKSSGVRNIASSKHYKKQSPLAGSLREMRGMIIRNLSNDTGVEQLKADARFAQAVKDLEDEGMINSTSGIIKLTK
jgi:A/G-specific adenine glycosylase